MKSTKMTRDKFINDLPSIICSTSASSELRIKMITRMLDQYTENLANGYDTRTEPVLPLQRVSQRSELFFAVLKWAKQADLDYPDDMLLKDFEQFTAKNCG